MDRPLAHASTAAGLAPDAGYPPPGRAWTFAMILVVGWTVAYLDRQIIIILIESLRTDMGLNDTQTSLLQGMAFSLLFVFAGIPIGRLVDRYNRRNILIFGILAWSVMTIFCGLATTFWQLFVARMGVGIGEACLAPASVSLISDLIRPARRGTATGLMIAGTSFGNAGSMFLGGSILQALGPHGTLVLPLVGTLAPWQVVFFAVGTPGLVVALLLLLVREPVRKEAARGAEGASFLAYARVNRRALALVYGAFTCSMIVGYSVSIWVPVVMLRIHGLQPGEVGALVGGVLLLVGTSGAALGGLASDVLFRRQGVVGRLGVVAVGYPLMLLIILGWLLTDSVNYTVALFALTAPLIGNMINGSSYTALNQMAPNELRGQVVAFYLMVANLSGLGIAPTAVALVTDYVFHDPQMLKYSIIAIAGPFAALGIVFSLLARKSFVRTAQRTAASPVGAGMPGHA